MPSFGEMTIPPNMSRVTRPGEMIKMVQYGCVIPPPLALRGQPHILNYDMTQDLVILIKVPPSIIRKDIGL
jgi:hypothetical protein